MWFHTGVVVDVKSCVHQYKKGEGAGEGEGTASATAQREQQLTVVFPRSEVDGAHKDMAQKLFGPKFRMEVVLARPLTASW